MASLAPSALTSLSGCTANTSNTKEVSQSPQSVRSRLLLCQCCCLPCPSEERLFLASAAPAWLSRWGGSTRVQDAAVPPPRRKMQQCWSCPAVTRGGALAAPNEYGQQEFAFPHPKYKRSVPHHKKHRRPESHLWSSSQGHCSWLKQVQATDHWEWGRSLPMDSPSYTSLFLMVQDGLETSFPMFLSPKHSKNAREWLSWYLADSEQQNNKFWKFVVKFCPTEMREQKNLFNPC